MLAGVFLEAILSAEVLFYYFIVPGFIHYLFFIIAFYFVSLFYYFYFYFVFIIYLYFFIYLYILLTTTALFYCFCTKVSLARIDCVWFPKFSMWDVFESQFVF